MPVVDARPSPDIRRARGRPSVLNAPAVAEAAIRLWSERGFQATSWRDIADQTGVSVRTLLRHFSSKADLAWIGVGPATERLREALVVTPASVPLSQAIRAAVVHSISHHAGIRRAGPDWLRLVAGEPDLVATAPAAYGPWTDTLADYIARRLPRAPRATCHALATAYQAAAFAAMLDWSQRGAAGDPADAVDETLRWLDVQTAH